MGILQLHSDIISNTSDIEQKIFLIHLSNIMQALLKRIMYAEKNTIELGYI